MGVNFAVTVLLGIAMKRWKKVLIGFFLNHLTWNKWNRPLWPGLIYEEKTSENLYEQKCHPTKTAVLAAQPFLTAHQGFFMLFPHLQDAPVHCNLALEYSLSKVAWEIHVIKINLEWSNASNCQNTSSLYYKFWVDPKYGADGVLVGWGFLQFIFQFYYLVYTARSLRTHALLWAFAYKLPTPVPANPAIGREYLKTLKWQGKLL